MTNRRGWALLAAWVVLLGAGVAWIQHRLVISADLRLFMPEPRTEAQRLLLQNVGESPASRLLLVTIGGAEPAVLARISKNLRDALRTHSEFELVTNGGSSFAPVGDLLEYRYLVTDSFDTRPLDAQRLSDELAERVADLSSPAAVMLEDWLPRDPTLEALHLMARWQPRFEPRLVDGVWFSADGTRALLMVESRAAAFDVSGSVARARRISSNDSWCRFMRWILPRRSRRRIGSSLRLARRIEPMACGEERTRPSPVGRWGDACLASVQIPSGP